jgi:redox-sensitive bicupin YhaK (pirin superfamily)
MNTILHTAESRGHAHHGWLDSYHTFSFARYHNPERIHFGALRVLNDDTVAPGMGFGQHPHDNMEIVSIPLEGQLRHRDTTGTEALIRTGDVQIMSAGSGLEHSEMNGSRTEPVKFLQIWVFPKERNITPRYDQKTFSLEGRKNQLQLVVSPDKSDEVIWINQDAWFTLSAPEQSQTVSYTLHREGHGVYLFVIRGSVSVHGQALGPRDGMGITETKGFDITATEDAEVLIMEVPMAA